MTPYIIAAFVGGSVAMLVRLPPLVGFLGAGFVLNYLDYDLTPTIATIGDLGVTLLLFTIGLKLNVRSLLRPEVWAASSMHLLGCTAGLAALIGALKLTGLGLLSGLTITDLALLGFALSFSSTVFAVKVLEGRSDLSSLHGRIAIGVLVMQDVFAVLFLTVSTGHPPSPWAILLFGLIPAAPLLRSALDRVGHGEMQVLFGVLLALVLGYALFDELGVKGDLGALIIGMLLAPAKAASGLSKSLFQVKELFLVGFFLTVGLTALPTWQTLAIAVLLVILLPLKAVLYYAVLTIFGLRSRTTLLTTLSLANYSEFGLIIAALAATEGWLSEDWLVVLAVAMALSFIVAAPLNAVSEGLYRHSVGFLEKFEMSQVHEHDRPIEIGDAEIVVLGMGRVGHAAYEQFENRYQMRVLGIDNDGDDVAKLRSKGVNALEGDASDSDFWEKVLVSPDVKLIVLAMPDHAGNLFALEQLRHREFPGKIAAVVRYLDEVEALKGLGADAVFNLYGEAGRGLAEDAMTQLGLTS